MAIQPSVYPQGPFDRLSFVKYVKNIGRAHRKQAMELISICRTFVQAQLQDFRSHDELTSVLQVVDDALKSAAAEKKTSKEVDEKFKHATDRLSIYERNYHFIDTVTKTMGAAKARDTSSSSILNKLKEKVLPMKDGWVEPTRTVEFHLHKSLPDKSPTIVKQVLCQSSSLKEILWNFSRFRDEKMRLTIKQNPHFYEVLPTIPNAYGDSFRIDPIDTFQHDRICVLTDNLGQTGRVFLETAHEARAFGNVWVPKNAIIFKDVCGKLEGESIVGATIKDTPNLCYFEEPPLSHSSRRALSPNGNSPLSTISATSTSSIGVPIQDWREPIYRMLQSLDVNIRITAKPPSNITPNRSVPSFPIPPAGPSSAGSLLPIVLSPLQPSITLQIPAQSAEPLTPSSYRTAQTTPPSPRPTAELSQTRTPLSPAPPPMLPSQLSPSATPAPSPVGLAVSHLPCLHTVVSKQATPAPSTARALPDTFQSRESQRIAILPPSPVALPVPLSGQPPTVVSPLTERIVPALPTSILLDGPEGRKSQEVPLPPSPSVAVLHPEQPTTVASPSGEQAIPALPTAHILPDIPLSWESQAAVVPQEAEAPVSSPVPIAGLPPSVLNVILVSPWQIINPETEDHESEFVDYVHIQAPVPGPINGVTSADLDLGVVSPSPPFQAPAAVPPPHDQLNVQKKNWFRKYIWDYKK